MTTVVCRWSEHAPWFQASKIVLEKHSHVTTATKVVINTVLSLFWSFPDLFFGLSDCLCVWMDSPTHEQFLGSFGVTSKLKRRDLTSTYSSLLRPSCFSPHVSSNNKTTQTFLKRNLTEFFCLKLFNDQVSFAPYVILLYTPIDIEYYSACLHFCFMKRETSCCIMFKLFWIKHCPH